MKLFNAIAAAAVIGISLITATPAEARNGWVKAGTSNRGHSYYVKKVSRNGHYVTYLERSTEDKLELKMIADCSRWQFRKASNTNWSPAMPDSVGGAILETACR